VVLERLEIMAMNALLSQDLRQMAIDCVSEMGDVFWDYDSRRDAHDEYRDPREIAIEEVEKTLRMYARLSVEDQRRSGKK